MGGTRSHKRNKKLRNRKMKMSNRNTGKQNEKPERTDDSGTPSQDDREDSTQRLGLDEAKKNKSDHGTPNQDDREDSIQRLGLDEAEKNKSDHGTPSQDDREDSTQRLGLDEAEKNKSDHGTPSQDDREDSTQCLGLEEAEKDKSDHGTPSQDDREDSTQRLGLEEAEKDKSDHGTPSQDDREDSTQRLSLKEAEKNKSDHDMSPNEKEGNEMEALGENDGNDNDDHCGKKPFETPRSKVCEVENSDRRNNHLRNNVKEETESNNEQSTSEEVFCQTERDNFDTEEQHRNNNTLKIEKGKQADHNHMDETESQTEHKHMNMDASQQNGEDGGKTNDIAMTQSNNDQTTPEKDQPIHMERTTESIGVNGAKIGVSPSQSFHTGDIKDNQMDNDNISTKTDTCYKEDEPMSSHSSEYGTDRGTDETPSSNASLNPQNQSREISEKNTSAESNDVLTDDVVVETTVVASDAKSGDDSPSQSVQNENIEHDNMNSEEMQRSASHTTIGSLNTSITMTPVQGLPSGAFGDDVGDPGVRNKEIPLDENEAGNNNVVGADNFENEADSIQSPTSGTNMAYFQGSDETHNSLSDIQNQSREISEKNTSAESNDVLTDDVVVETTVVASDAKSGDDSPSQSVQNENIEHDNINSEEMQRSASHTTIGSLNTSITMTPVQGLPSGAFGDDVGDPGVRNKEIPLDENEAGNNNVVGADNFENEADSIQSPTSGTNMAYFQGSDETHNSLSDIQNQSREISEKNTSAESNDVLTDDVVVETTVVASDAKSGDDSPSQSVQNENIEHGNMNSEEMQRSASPTTIDSPNTSITMTPVQGLPSGAFGDDVGDPGVRNGEVDNDSTSTETENNEDETMSHVNGEKTAVDVGPSQSLQTGDIKDDQMDGTEERHHHGHVDQQNGQVDNDSTSTKADNNEDEPMSPQSSEYGTDRGSDENPSSNASLNPRNKSRGILEEDTSMEPSDEVRETTVVASVAKSGDDNTLQSVENENIDRGNINSEGMQCSASPNTIDSPNTYTTMKPVQGQSFRAFGDDVGDPGLRNGEMSLDENESENNNVVSADNYENEMVSFQSPTSGTNMAHYQGSDETHNSLSDIQNQSREVSEKNTSAESNDVLREDAVVETTVIASDVNSGDDYTSQSVQNENIDHSNINSEEMQRSASTTTIDSPNSSITTTPVQEQPSRAFGDDVSDSGLRNGELSLYENETENDNVVNADNFENEMDSPQSSESGNDMAHYEGSNETLSFNLLSDIQLKTSQEKEIEKLQRELNIKNENLATLKEEMKRRDEIINEKNSENADLLHRCVASETSAEAADDLREQCEDKNHQIETLEVKTSQEKEIEKLQRELNIKNENLVTLQEEMKRRDEIINEKNSENADLLHRCVASETSAEAADDLREQCEDKTHQIETLEVKTSQEKEIEKLQRELNIKNENLVTLQEEMKRRDEIINEKNSENADLLHRCVASETSAEAADDLREQCEDKTHQIETLEGDLASVRNENESLKRHLEETENVAADHQRLIDDNKSLNEYLEQDRQSSAALKEEAQALKEQITNKEDVLKELESQIKKAIEEKEELGAKLASRNENNSDFLSNYLEMKKKEEEMADQAEKEKEFLKQRVTKLTECSQQLQAENKRIKDDLQLKSMECGNLKSERLRITECMQKVVREKQEMMYSMGNLQRIELENHQLKHQIMDQSEQITKLHASLQEYGLLRDHIQEYYKAFQDSQLELQREKEKSRHINELLSKTGYRLDSMASELNNYRTMTEGYRRLLEEEKEKFNKLERKLDRPTIDNEKLKEERDKCEQKRQAECRDLLSKTQEGPSDGTTSLLQGFGNPSSQSKFVLGFGNPSSQSKFVLGIGRDKMNRKK
nr:uncharacterized protein LOC105337045 isoform X5 [Crassostrea gigas]